MSEITRRRLLQYGAGTGAAMIFWRFGATNQVLAAPVPGGTLDPTSVPKFVTPLVIPPAMPRTSKLHVRAGKNVEYFEIGVRQFAQHLLPRTMGLEPTTVWSYGSVNHPGSFHYPAFTIEARWRKPVRVKWINELVDSRGDYLPHLLPVDQTLHWANPPAGPGAADSHGMDPSPYTGPVPIVTHLHGGHSSEESDGYAEAWYLPAARNIPHGFARAGSLYGTFKEKAERVLGQRWTRGSAVFQYDNVQAATTMWYHDHTLGMTRSNVYAGPAGFYLLRGGPGDAVGGTLPGPAPSLGDMPGRSYHEIPIAIQDRSFNADGSLFYPDGRAFFEELDPSQLQIPFIPDRACGGPSDIAPIWNPEFFGNTIVVNGQTWPFLEVEQRRYRFRILNGCNSRFLLLKLSNGLPFWQIGSDGGFLPGPVRLDELLLAPAERADVIVDFTGVAVASEIVLLNLAPDEPFGGGAPDEDFDVADPETTGQVMQLRVVAATGVDTSTPPDRLVLPPIKRLPPAAKRRRLSLNEEDSRTVLVRSREDGAVILDCDDGEPFGPRQALLGTVGRDGEPIVKRWDDPITENPAVGATEIWELHNFTADAHPIHIHEITFEVVERESIATGAVRGPEPWETGRKDTVIAYPEEITRVKATFDRAGLFVWHCHIVEHEDHEMMRPYRIGP
jgi:spore coat protein A, manganese oxidase